MILDVRSEMSGTSTISGWIPIKFDFAKEIGIKMCEEVYGDTNGLKSHLLSSLTINVIHILPRIVSHTNQGLIKFDSTSKHRLISMNGIFDIYNLLLDLIFV